MIFKHNKCLEQANFKIYQVLQELMVRKGHICPGKLALRKRLKVVFQATFSNNMI